MTTAHNIEVQQAIHQAATELAALEFIDQETARHVLYCQAETGRATPENF